MTDEVKVTQADRAGREDAIAKVVADRCSQFDKKGNPKSPHRYAIIYQAARLGAIEAANRQSATSDALEAMREAVGTEIDTWEQVPLRGAMKRKIDKLFKAAIEQIEGKQP